VTLRAEVSHSAGGVLEGEALKRAHAHSETAIAPVGEEQGMEAVGWG